ARVEPAAAAHEHVLLDLLRDDRSARSARAVRHLRVHVAAVPRAARALHARLLRSGRLRGAVLAPRRSHLDLPLPLALPDSLRRAPWLPSITTTITTTASRTWRPSRPSSPRGAS